MPVDRQDNSRDRQQIMLRAIGRVISPDAVEPKEIEIAPGFANGLDGVEEHEHLWILYMSTSGYSTGCTGSLTLTAGCCRPTPGATPLSPSAASLPCIARCAPIRSE